MVSCLMFKSLRHFEFTSVHGVMVCSNFIDVHAAIQHSQYHLKRLDVFSPSNFIFLPSLSRLIQLGVWIYFWALCFISFMHIDMADSHFTAGTNTLMYSNYIPNLKFF